MRIPTWLPWVLLFVIALGGYVAWRADESADLQLVQESRTAIERLKGRAQAAEDSTRAADLVAEYWEAAYRRKAEEAPRIITRWRSLPRPEPGDTAAARRQAVGDSLAAVCEDVLRGCDRALAAKDTAILAERSARFAQATRADSLEVLTLELGDRLERASGRFKKGLVVGAALTALIVLIAK